jgi:hypothetical protein
MKARYVLLTLGTAFLAAVVLFYPQQASRPKQEKVTPVLSRVAMGMLPVFAYQESLPSVEKLSEVGSALKTTADSNAFQYTLVEEQGQNMQLAVIWKEKVWVFKGSCSQDKTHLWLTSGDDSVKEYEPNEWVLPSPSTMKIVFEQVNVGYTEKKETYITCNDLKWTISK